MAKKEKEYKVPSTRQPVYSVFKLIIKCFFKRPKIINLAGELAEKSIVLANHSNKSGPPCLDMYYPRFNVKWGAYQMFGNYASRKAYLRDVLYIKKCKKSRTKAVIASTLMATVSQFVYKGMKMIPTYPDVRIAKTIRDSMKVLDANKTIMVFPEDSNDGYKEVLTDFFPGFVILSEKYYRATGEDLPIYPVYYHITKRVMVIGEAVYMQDLVKQGMDRNQIARFFCDKVNGLFFDYIQNGRYLEMEGYVEKKKK
ncbi:MAG: hypothetical protein E7346_06940 [Clostridiales bacterium]|nr:hypothetical protein [Clostridiales bacterium]